MAEVMPCIIIHTLHAAHWSSAEESMSSPWWLSFATVWRESRPSFSVNNLHMHTEHFNIVGFDS